MGLKIKIFALLVIPILICIILTWAPWLNDQDIHDRVLKEWGRQDGTIDIKGKQVCDYEVSRFFLGRLVTSCEGGYYVTFWGQIL